MTSLIHERQFPVLWLREFARKPLAFVRFFDRVGFDLAKTAEFPAIFPITPGYSGKTSSQVTVCTTTYSCGIGRSAPVRKRAVMPLT